MKVHHVNCGTMCPFGGSLLSGEGRVAVRGDGGWLLHCGDAFFNRHEVQTPPSCPPGLRAFQAMMAMDGAKRRHNQERLRELQREHGGEVTLICAHDHVQLDEFAAA